MTDRANGKLPFNDPKQEIDKQAEDAGFAEGFKVSLKRDGENSLPLSSLRVSDMHLHLPRMEGYARGKTVRNGPALAGHGAEAVWNAVAQSMMFQVQPEAFLQFLRLILLQFRIDEPFSSRRWINGAIYNFSNFRSWPNLSLVMQKVQIFISA